MAYLLCHSRKGEASDVDISLPVSIRTIHLPPMPNKIHWLLTFVRLLYKCLATKIQLSQILWTFDLLKCLIVRSSKLGSEARTRAWRTATAVESGRFEVQSWHHPNHKLCECGYMLSEALSGPHVLLLQRERVVSLVRTLVKMTKS